MGSLIMLRSKVDFAALHADARSRIDPLLVLRFRRNGLDQTRYGISTSRKTGSAVVRNRIRRRLRTLLVALAGRVSAGWDVLIIARLPAAGASQAQLGDALERLLRQAGISQTDGAA